MAEASSPSNRNVLCRYFVNGVCRFGRNCQYSHDRDRGVPDNVCRYYIAGNCTFGSRCRYEHVRSTEPSRAERSQPVSATSQPPPASSSSTEGSSSHHHGGARAKRQQHSSSKWNTNAREFVPEKFPSSSSSSSVWESYKEALNGLKDIEISSSQKKKELCPFFGKGKCPYEESCQYIHGEECELCGKLCLHPFDEVQRKNHKTECIKVLEDDMKLSFAISRSNDKNCGICMETVLEKSESKERQFGILTGCNHIFCLNCIREWRGRKEYKANVVRACPECRIHSDFIVPSPYWYEDADEKEKFISDYKQRLSKRPCKYFNQGRGKCPFSSLCFYLHAYEDGTVATNEEPPRPRQRRVRTAANTFRAIQESLLWDFLEEREGRGATFSSIIELDDEFIIQLLNSVGEGDSDDDTYSDMGEVSDEYFDSDWTDDDDDYNHMRFAFIS